MIEKYKIKTDGDWHRIKSIRVKEKLLFKYSPMCGVSYSVEKKFKLWLEEIKESKDYILAEINVITARDVSRNIADEINVKHESPQLIWLDADGNVKMHESHHNIITKMLNSNLKKALK